MRKYICPQCKTVWKYPKTEENIICSKCGNRWLMPVRKSENNITQTEKPRLFQICWKHRDFAHSSTGPILRHGKLSKGALFTEADANDFCYQINQKSRIDKATKKPIVRHWVEEVIPRRHHDNDS